MYTKSHTTQIVSYLSTYSPKKKIVILVPSLLRTDGAVGVTEIIRVLAKYHTLPAQYQIISENLDDRNLCYKVIKKYIIKKKKKNTYRFFLKYKLGGRF